MRSTPGVLTSLLLLLCASAAAEDPSPQAPAPAPPARDFGFTNGAASATVPFTLINNHIYVEVKLSGHGPYRLVCDTGGTNIITPEVAAELGAKPKGNAAEVSRVRIGRVEIGEAFIDNQLFHLLPLGTFSNVEGVPASGLMGYEIFNRFVVRIDYESSRLTLIEPENFTYTGAGTAVPFKLNEHLPQVEGVIDGIKGAFNIDTGSRSSIDLFAPFVDQHKLRSKYRARFEGVTSWGANGPSRAAIARAQVLKLGEVEIRGAVTELTLKSRAAFTNENGAGNVGAGVLRRFNLVFDYPRQVIHFERNANDAQPDLFDRSGMWINVTEGGISLDVVDVVAGGPADRAGLKAGDHLLTVDGKKAYAWSLSELRQRFRTDPPGTSIQLEYERAGKVTNAEVILRDLI